MPNSKKKIKILPSGPYQVSGNVPLKQEIIEADAKNPIPEKWVDGKKYETPATYTLCRCGHSKNMPFCDGTHAHNGFKGEETASRAPYKQNAALLKGRDYDMYDDENLCAVARFCERGNSVWNYIEEGGEEANKIAIEEACACPSGRLTVVDKKGKVIEPKLEQGISATQDPAKNVRGPLWVKGGIEIEGADGATYEVRNRVTLCRCGESSNMPFCDATHLNCPHMKGQDK